MTPDTIRTRTFQTVKKNGYDPAEVQDFLLDVAAQLEDLQGTAAQLTQDKALLQQQLAAQVQVSDAKSDKTDPHVMEVLEELRNTSKELIEQSKTNAAAIAMRAEQDRRVLFDQARKEADIIIRDAEKKADAILDAAHAKVQEFRDEIGILQARRIAIISRVKSLLASQQQFLEALEKDAVGQTQELTDFMKETGNKAGINAEQLQAILDKLDDKSTGTE